MKIKNDNDITEEMNKFISELVKVQSMESPPTRVIIAMALAIIFGTLALSELLISLFGVKPD